MFAARQSGVHFHVGVNATAVALASWQANLLLRNRNTDRAPSLMAVRTRFVLAMSRYFKDYSQVTSRQRELPFPCEVPATTGRVHMFG